MAMLFRLFVFAVVMMSAAPLMAQSNDGTTPAHQPLKNVQKMTAEERRAYWESLPEETKKRILERRRAVAGEAAPGATPSVAPSETGQPQKWEELSPERQKNAKAEWDAMSAEQKKAFIMEHKDELQTMMRARAGQ